MRIRMLFMFGIGAMVGMLAVAGSTLWAQQNLAKVPSVITPNGFLVEEVRVGQSCVVIVARSGPPTNYVEATPGTN